MTTSKLPTPFNSPALAPPRQPDALAGGGYLDPDGELDWRRILNAVVRFKWVIVAVTVVGTTAGVAATRFLKPQYVAQATIWIDQTDRRGPDRGPIRPSQLLERGAWLDLLTSYVVLDEVVRAQQLCLELKAPGDAAPFSTFQIAEQYRPGAYRLTVDGAGRRYALTTVDGSELEHGAVGDSIGSRLGFRWAPGAGVLVPGRTMDFDVATPRDAARRLADALVVRPDLDGGFLRVELGGASPTRIAAIVNAIVQRYAQVAADLKRQKLEEVTKILAEQLQYSQQNLQDAETALESFRVRTITLPSDRGGPSATVVAGAATGGAGDAPRDPLFTNFFDVQLEREQARRDRDVLERLLAQAGDSGLSADALGVVGSVQRSAELSQALKELIIKQAELRALRYRYADQYPPVQRLVGEIATLQRQGIPALARALVSELAVREAEFGRRVDADSRTLRGIPARSIEEARLRRAVGLAENLYTTLQQRYQEARVAVASSVPDVRVLDAAVVPQRAVRNRAPQVILFAFFGSLGLAMVGAVLVDRGDPRVRYPYQVSREMGLTILGAVPHLRLTGVPGRNGNARPPEDIAAIVEGLRGICLNLVYAHGATVPLLVTITSPEPGDGKSFLSANIAHTFAQGGHRTLLIDGDIRRGVLHRRLNGRRRPGLTDFLRGETSLDTIIQATPYPAFSLIGCGVRSYNGPELLGSAAMSQLLTTLRSSYDVILIDSSPLAAGVDPLILGMLTQSLALVLRTGYSHREVAASKLEALQRLPLRLLGAILNDVPPRGG
ncbi:MAG: hypothetical protein AUI55_07955, partial [Gemmatimonadetes bacterium 13_1_40CM_2_70_7]